MARKFFYTIHGSVFSLYKEINHKRTNKQLIKRKFVESAFIELWFKLSEGLWDEDLWEQISDENKDFMAYSYYKIRKTNPELDFKENKGLDIAVSKKFKNTQKRLNLIEGMIKSGNFNEALVEEFNTIMDNLISTNQIPALQGTRLKKRLERTFNNLKTTA
jgi:hypothetical protein